MERMGVSGGIMALEEEGVLDLKVGGVRLLIDGETEESYIEVGPVHTREALRHMEQLANNIGYELVPEWDYPPEDLSGGVTRHWLEEKETA